jgi:hypothetical protein
MLMTCVEHVPLSKRAHVYLEARRGEASREAAGSLGLHLLMKLTISTFLFVTLQFVLARSSVATTFAL